MSYAMKRFEFEEEFINQMKSSLVRAEQLDIFNRFQSKLEARFETTYIDWNNLWCKQMTDQDFRISSYTKRWFDETNEDRTKAQIDKLCNAEALIMHSLHRDMLYAREAIWKLLYYKIDWNNVSKIDIDYIESCISKSLDRVYQHNDMSKPRPFYILKEKVYKVDNRGQYVIEDGHVVMEYKNIKKRNITKEEFLAELDLDKSLAENASIVCPKKNISISTFKYLVWKHKVKFNKDGRTGCKKPSLKKCNKELPAYIVEYRFKDFLKKLELIHPDIFNAYTEGTLRQYYKRRRKELGIKRSKKIEDPMAKEELLAEIDFSKSRLENAKIVSLKKGCKVGTFLYYVKKYDIKFSVHGNIGKGRHKKYNIPTWTLGYSFKDFLIKLEETYPEIFDAYTEGTLRQYYKRKRKELGIKTTKKINIPTTKTLDKKIKETVKKDESMDVKKDELVVKKDMFKEEELNKSIFSINALSNIDTSNKDKDPLCSNMALKFNSSMLDGVTI